MTARATKRSPSAESKRGALLAALGFAIVGAFSFGLALTMVSVGAMAAWSVQHAQKRFSGFGEAMRKAPYVSCALLTLLAIYMAYSGWHGLAYPHTH